MNNHHQVREACSAPPCEPALPCTDWRRSWRTWGPRCLSPAPPPADGASTLPIETLPATRLRGSERCCLSRAHEPTSLHCREQIYRLSSDTTEAGWRTASEQHSSGESHEEQSGRCMKAFQQTPGEDQPALRHSNSLPFGIPIFLLQSCNLSC